MSSRFKAYEIDIRNSALLRLRWMDKKPAVVVQAWRTRGAIGIGVFLLHNKSNYGHYFHTTLEWDPEEMEIVTYIIFVTLVTIDKYFENST